MTQLVHNQADLREALDEAPAVLVPTMGALHDGHRALIEVARDWAKAQGDHAKVVVSIFVNPFQFEDPADFENYPTDLITDTALATEWGADVIWAPATDDIYGLVKPEGDLRAGALGEVFEGVGRPGHFDGVLKAVGHLFAVVKPRAAVFGEKDFQQLVLVRRLAAQQSPPVEILPVVTQRDLDGVALSSRLVRLSKLGRTAVQAIPQALACGAAAAQQGSTPDGVIAAVLGELDSVAEVHPEYVAVVDDTMAAPSRPGSARILIAVTIEGVRIIDNEPIELAAV